MLRMVSTVPTIRSSACFSVSRVSCTDSFLVVRVVLEEALAPSRARPEGEGVRGFKSADAASRFCRRSADKGEGGRNLDGELDVTGDSLVSNARRAFDL